MSTEEYLLNRKLQKQTFSYVVEEITGVINLSFDMTAMIIDKEDGSFLSRVTFPDGVRIELHSHETDAKSDDINAFVYGCDGSLLQKEQIHVYKCKEYILNKLIELIDYSLLKYKIGCLQLHNQKVLFALETIEKNTGFKVQTGYNKESYLNKAWIESGTNSFGLPIILVKTEYVSSHGELKFGGEISSCNSCIAPIKFSSVSVDRLCELINAIKGVM